MLSQKTWLNRALTVATGAVLTVGAAELPAYADYTVSTTGATGTVGASHAGSGPLGYPYSYDLYITDTLTDGHCARWQQKIGAGAWTWYGTESCGGKVYAGLGWGKYSYVYRVCRTGVGNCSAPQEFA